MTTENTLTAGNGGAPNEDRLLLPAVVERQLAKIDRTETAVDAATRRADAVQIRNADELEAAAVIVRALNSERKTAEANRKEVVGPLNAHVKKMNARFKTLLDPLDAALVILKDKVTAYNAVVEKARLHEQRRLEREAAERERAARAERHRAEAEARAERERAEAAAAAAAAEAAAADTAVTDDGAHPRQATIADERLEAERERLERARAQEATLAALPDVAAPVPVVPEAPRVEGLQRRRVWKMTVVDPALVPREFLVVNSSALEQAMRANISDDRERCDLTVAGVTFDRVETTAVS